MCHQPFSSFIHHTDLQGLKLESEEPDVCKNIYYKWMSQKLEKMEYISSEAAQAVEVDVGKKTFLITRPGLSKKTSFRFASAHHYMNQITITKRKMQRKTATVYGSFGLLTPYILRAKMLMREAWMEVLGWNEQLPII